MHRHLVLALLLLLSCCGGGAKGNDGGSADLSNLTGTYWAVALAATTVTTDSETTWGTLVSDGAGSIMPHTTTNDDGVVSTPLLTSSFGYEIDANGEIRFLLGPNPVYRGRITDDGRYAVLSSLGEPRIIVLVRREGTHTVADIAGTYAFAGAGFATGPAAYTMSAAFDGIGLFAGTGAVNEAGSLDGGTHSGTYGVSPSGAVSMGILGVPFLGGLGGDNNFVLLGGGTTNGNDPLGWFLVRRPDTGAGNSLLAGTYYAGGVETVLGSMDEAQAFWGVVQANGLGGFTLQGQTTGPGAVAPLALSGTYGVAGDGTLTMNRGGLIENLTGAVSPDGRVAIASGGTTASSNPVLILMFRR